MRAIKVGTATLVAEVANISWRSRVGIRESATGRCAYRIDGLIVDRFTEGVCHAQSQPVAEASPQSELRGMVIRIATVIELGNHSELLIRPELQTERVVLDAGSQVADAVKIEVVGSS